MVSTAEDLERFLDRLTRRYERTPEGTYLLAAGAEQPPIGVRLAPPVLVAQATIGLAPKGDAALEARFFRRLLELNGSELMHAAYSLSGDMVVLGAALPLDNLDLNELEAVLSAFDLALATHVPALRAMAKPA